MFGFNKSYTKDDVYKVTMLWRDIEKEADVVAPSVPEGMLTWAQKDPDIKHKIHKAFGIQHGFISGKYEGRPDDFEKFFKEVIYKIHNLGFSMNFGRVMYQDHMRLRRAMDQDYLSGVKEGEEQAETGKQYYAAHRKIWNIWLVR
ncbi:MAG: hypothetical protein ACRDGA_03515 [Bacteroidota bacterium]